MKTLYIADPLLESWQGHNLSYDIAVYCGVRQVTGHDVNIWANRCFRGEVPEELAGKITPVYNLAFEDYRLMRYFSYFIRRMKTNILDTFFSEFFGFLRKIKSRMSFRIESKNINSDNVSNKKSVLDAFLAQQFSTRRYKYIALLLLCFSPRPLLHFLYTLRQIKKDQVSESDVIFCHTIPDNAFFLWSLVADYCTQRGIHVALLFRYDPALSIRSTIRNKVALQLYRRCFLHGRINYFTDSSRLAQSYTMILSSPVHVLPIPHIPVSIPKQCKANTPIHVSVLGNPREEKGFREVVAMLEIINALPEAREFIFHIQTSNPNPSIPQKILDRLEGLEGAQIRLLTESLDANAYSAVVGQTDIMLLPYRTDWYRAATSGVLFEAFCCGKVILTTENTWLAEEMHKFGSGVAVPDRDPAALLQGLLHLGKDIDRYLEKAAGKMTLYRSMHGAEKFARALMGKVGTNFIK